MSCAAASSISTLSLHDALPICVGGAAQRAVARKQREDAAVGRVRELEQHARDCRPMSGFVVPRFRNVGRNPERSEEHTSELSHVKISYAVFCLKKKNDVILSLT